MRRFFAVAMAFAFLFTGCDAAERSTLKDSQRTDGPIDRLWHDGKLSHQIISGGYNLGDCAENSQGQPRLSIVDGHLHVFSDGIAPADRLTRVTISCSWKQTDVKELTDQGALTKYTDIINQGGGVLGIVTYSRIAPGMQLSFYGDDQLSMARSLSSISFNLAVRGSYSDQFTPSGRTPRDIPVVLKFAFPEAMKVVTLSDLERAVKQLIRFPTE